MARSNPIGLAEPSVKRDGYAVGRDDGTLYRSTGNLSMVGGSGRARSAAATPDRDVGGGGGGWKGRRASASDIKGESSEAGSQDAFLNLVV